MIKISEGPSLRRYAMLYLGDLHPDDAVQEVIQWVSAYVNGPWTKTQEEFGIEPTERERLESIKAYITSQIDNSTYGRIRNAQEGAKSAISEAIA